MFDVFINRGDEFAVENFNDKLRIQSQASCIKINRANMRVIIINK